eukprot:TRINITY_DN68013_c6_g1_i1.p2 TRINITY_DN68013_c6_g1~~TRINITY_DN68013_c6_g1_i1.p2  ORF type:complete len:122 (+),score=18.87 TRINITY_DN68013_c6_g1_i1:46-411(+)
MMNFIPHTVGAHNGHDRAKVMEAFSKQATLDDKAYKYEQQGRYDESIECYKEALQHKKRKHGNKTAHVCLTYCGLGTAYLGRFKYRWEYTDLVAAKREATTMLSLAEELDDEEQKKIALGR